MAGYPVILGGDHAAFEQEWAASGKPDTERPDWPLPSFDARDWARAFCDVVIEKGFRPEQPEDEGWIISWFANALMRGYDEHASRVAALNLDPRCERGCTLRKVNATLRNK